MTMQSEYLDLVQMRNEAVLQTARLALAYIDSLELAATVVLAADSTAVLNARLAQLQTRMETHYRERVLR